MDSLCTTTICQWNNHMLYFDDPIEKVLGIGEKTARRYKKLGIYSVSDLVKHYPRTYEVYAEISAIGSIQGEGLYTIEGVLIGRPKLRTVRNLTIITVDVKDKTGTIRVTWFNMPFIAKIMRPGVHYILRGNVRFRNGMWSLVQPQIMTSQEYYDTLHRYMPVYSLTEGVTNNTIRKSVKNALEHIGQFDEVVPDKIRRQYGLMTMREALFHIHFPKNEQDMAKAREKLVFDEFFVFIRALRKEKNERVLKESGPCVKEEMCGRMLDDLPYKLTGAQERTWDEIKADMKSGYAMNRMIQGDVGSGKTIIALLSLLFNHENGSQGALMVPTEVLARQHYEECIRYFEKYGVKTGLLVGSMTAAQKRTMYEMMETGEVDVVIGTHALIQEKVHFANLGLVITDEQHRFGVKQREYFAELGKECHTLVMSATPIPRSLAIVLYGNMDLSVIDEMPAGRLPIKNCVVDPSYRPNAYRFIAGQVAMGNQVYIICPMVDENEQLEIENVTEYTEELKEILPDGIRITSLHGQMKDKMKNEIMQSFAAGEIDILVSTTVIEVGINVPNATVMMVENAERFGLAQLHQLRGRVGRGKKQSYAIFINSSRGREAAERLDVLNNSNDGFYIASMDLKLRGPGEILGVKQSGELMFDLADVYRDKDILLKANEAVNSL